MPKTLIVSATIDSIRSKVDRSLGMTVSTPELTSEEKAEFMNIQGLNVTLKIEPQDVSSEEMTISTEKGVKTPGQRLRAVIFVYWKQYKKEGEEFEAFYRRNMDSIIETYKSKLD